MSNFFYKAWPANTLLGVLRCVVASAVVLPAFWVAPAIAQECIPDSGAPEPPASQRRTIDVDEWQVSFAIPENYRTMRDGSTLEILSPSSYEILACILTRRPTHNIRPYSISVSMLDRTLTEAEIRSQLRQGRGRYWGTTAMPSGTAFMHTTVVADNIAEEEQVHLSLPMPDQAATVVFSASTDSTGEIVQEDVLETVLETFRFEGSI
ncbi:MAG: hypothetical protein AAFY72_07660 [Cyanobacteria bacterium J06649_4]